MRKPAGAKDWDCRQSCFTRLTFSFRIADVRKVGLSSKLLTEKSQYQSIKRTAGRPGLYIINSTFNTISLLVISFEIKKLVMSKDSLGSLLIKTRSVGRGKRGMGSKFLY